MELQRPEDTFIPFQAIFIVIFNVQEECLH